ncbi:acyl carrier protein [Anaerobiospirillum succiniciproducens]|uniref:acyl carrier protein n=1 Tax=Anaerobiospirillum succiniciproducens TaxID=13335 RepID=UPI00248D9818|nr:acyl carrier protein [Anaerobiospirillum succiniciproducens]
MRNKEEILEEFKKLLEEEFEVDPQSITLDSLLYEDLDLDSIDAVDMIVYIQKKTKTKVKPEVFKSVRTVGDVVNVIDDLIQQSKTEHNS